MPNRIVRELILTSDRVDSLDNPTEVFYRRLMSKVDDYGRYDARPSILRTSLFPLRVDRVREADCTRWLAACQKAGLIVLYSHAGKPYLEMADTGWQVRSESKFPAPPKDVENICAQVQTTAHLVVDVGVVVDDEKQGAPPTAPPAAKLDAKGSRIPADWQASPEELAWAKAKRPDLDIPEELEKFRDYWLAVPGAKGRKTSWALTWKTWVRNAHAKPVGKFTPPTLPAAAGNSPAKPETPESRAAAQAAFEQSLKEYGYAN